MVPILCTLWHKDYLLCPKAQMLLSPHCSRQGEEWLETSFRWWTCFVTMNANLPWQFPLRRVLALRLAWTSPDKACAVARGSVVRLWRLDSWGWSPHKIDPRTFWGRRALGALSASCDCSVDGPVWLNHLFFAWQRCCGTACQLNSKWHKLLARSPKG